MSLSKDQDKKITLVANAFNEYARTGKKSLIKSFSREEIITTMNKHHSYVGDRDSFWYSLMDDRVAEFDSITKYKRARTDIWKDRIWSFLIGLLAGLILMWCKFQFFTEKSP
jgi:hypothetical protein